MRKLTVLMGVLVPPRVQFEGVWVDSSQPDRGRLCQSDTL
jgi:hypothetical protein